MPESLTLVKKGRGRPRKPWPPVDSPTAASVELPETPTVAELYADKPYKDKALLNEDGSLSDFTLPMQDMTRTSYEREMRRSSHLGYANFLKHRSLDDLKLALSRSESPKANAFLKALTNPKFIDVDIAVLAEKYRIGFGELMAVWRHDKLTESMVNILDMTPKVAHDTAIDAQSSQTCCTRCDGAGVMKVQRGDEEYSWVQCVSCQGTGAIRKIGDARSRQYVFEATGIIKSGAGVSVNINTGASSSVDSVIDELESITIPVASELVNEDG